MSVHCTPLEWHIQQNHESVIVELVGDLTRETLLPLWTQRTSFFTPKANQHIYWDFKYLNHVDSAGFTLLVELLNHYQKQNPTCIIGLPKAIYNLAELFDLDEWFSQFLYCEIKQ